MYKAIAGPLAAGYLTMLLFTQPCVAARAQSLPAPPVEWSYSSASNLNGSATQSFSAWPANIVVPAVSGVRHVVDCVSITVGWTGNTQGSPEFAVVQLQDGVAGSAALLQWAVLPQINAQTINLCGLNVVGTAGNAMTLTITKGGNYYGFEYTEYASLNLIGHDAN